MGMSSHSVLDLSIWGKSCRSVLPENGGVEKSKNKLLFTEWKLTKTFMVFENYRRFAVFLWLIPSLVPTGCTVGRNVLLVLMTFHYCLLPPAVSFLLPSGFRYVPFFGCPVTGWSWGEQYLDRCWLSSAISAQQNWTSRVGSCFGENVPIVSLFL